MAQIAHYNFLIEIGCTLIVLGHAIHGHAHVTDKHDST